MPADWVQLELIEDLGMDEARLISTTIVIGLTLLLYLLAPLVVGRLVRLRNYATVEEQFGDELQYIEETVKWPFPTRAVVRTIQLVVVFVSILSLLTVWGYENQAVFLVEVATEAIPWLIRLLFTFLLLAAAVILTRLLQDRLKSYTEEADHVSEHQEGVAFRVLQISVFGAVIIAVISLWGVDLTGLLLGAGFLGIVLGMAAQKTLGSLIAGLVLMFSRPFEIGDWVSIGDHEGIVIDITIVNTRLRSFNDETIVLPNDAVGNQTVVNYTHSERLRLSLDVGVDYDTDVEFASEVALEAIEGIDVILRNPTPSVVPTTFDDSAIGLRLRYWIEHPSKPKEWMAHAAVLQAVKEAFDKAHIEIPYPQRTISERTNTEPTD